MQCAGNPFVLPGHADRSMRVNMVLNADCVRLLQWALPRLRLRWPGFRKVRRQVCKRIQRRLEALELGDVEAYRAYLETHVSEWAVLDGFCRISVSRFYRDKAVFGMIEDELLPDLARRVRAAGRTNLQFWSAGCGSGEEPYTLSLLWNMCLAALHPRLSLDVTATDADPQLLARAARACYTFGSIKDLPATWRETGFVRTEQDEYCLKRRFREKVAFLRQDIRITAPADRFDMILCRNLVFTYFDDSLQRRTAERLVQALGSGGLLIIGVHERLPQGMLGLKARSVRLGIYQRV
jgi:chemotaxis protein methyltransferase CheR